MSEEFNIDGIGNFKYNDALSSFEAELMWLRNKCTITLKTDLGKTKTINKSTEILKKLYEDPRKWDQMARKCAAEDLIEIANEWEYDSKSDNDIKEIDFHSDITKKTFYARLKINSINISPNGDIEFYYDDDNIFFGHCVMIKGNISDAFTEANLY